MELSGIFFIVCFLPILLLIDRLVSNERVRRAVLTLAGLVFYVFAGLWGVVFLLAFSAVNYAFLCLLAKKPGKGLLTLSVAANLALLGLVKYLNPCLSFFRLQTVGLAAPLGISFAVFRGISALVDTSRTGKKQAASYPDFLLYLSFFPQAVAGPIMRCGDFCSQLPLRRADSRECADGLCRFLCGLGKKLILATAVGNITNAVFALPKGELNAAAAWLGAVCYSMEIYLDFSSYSDMAIGLGLAFGIRCPENFDHPYTARSIGEFWRRWHISLSTWFKDYLYIPLGGNRKGENRTALNKAIVFTLCGVWHGASLPYLVWGMWHGLFSALESKEIIPIQKLKALRFGDALAHGYTLLTVCLGFVIFRAETLSAAGTMLSAMFTGFFASAQAMLTLKTVLTPYTLCMLLPAAILSLSDGKKRIAIPDGGRYALCLLLFALCLMKMAAGGFAPFIYAQF